MADALVNLFKTSSGGKSVRIDGEWGSGKSTVVRLLAHKLQSGPSIEGVEPEFIVFLYDVWVHSGDPLKRAFFTALLDQIEAKGWLQKSGGAKPLRSKLTRDYWNEQLDILSSRIKRSQKKETPSFTKGARSAMALLAAFGAGIPYLLKLLGYFEGYVGPVAIGLLVIVLVFVTVWRVPEDLLNYILLRNSDTKSLETRGDYTPTSLDFQEVFGKLMEAIFQGNDRRIVVVVDNLDRIVDTEIRDVWSLLRSFLDNPAFSSAPWFQRLWVVVPIADAPKVGASIATGTDSKSTNAFLEKIFQVRFRLPPPMLHSWKSYLRSGLEKAFGPEQENEYEDVQRIYEIYLTDRKQKSSIESKQSVKGPPALAKSQVTPRAMVSFINELVAMRLEHVEAAGLPLLAAYQLATNAVGRDENGLPIIDSYVATALGLERLVDAWAMLHYHASSLDEASYILAYPIVDVALRVGNIKTVASLMEKGPGASHILQRYIREDLPELKGISLVRAAYALHYVGASESVSRDNRATVPSIFSEKTVKEFTDTVQRGLETSDELKIADDLIVESVSALFDILPSQEETAQKILYLLSHEGSAPPPENAPPRDMTIWLDHLAGLINLQPVSRLLKQDQSRKVVVSVNERDWAAVLARFGGGELKWALASITSSIYAPLEMNRWFANQLLSDLPDPNFEQSFGYVIDGSAESLLAIAGSVVERILPNNFTADAGNKRVSQKQALSAVSRILCIEHGGMRDLFRDLMVDDILGRFLEEAKQTKQEEDIAKWALLTLWICDNEFPPNWAILQQTIKQVHAGPKNSQVKVEPNWVQIVRSFLSAVAWSNTVDNGNILPFIFQLKLFAILNCENTINMMRENLNSVVAKSMTLHIYLEDNGIDIRTFAEANIAVENVRKKFIDEYSATSRG